MNLRVRKPKDETQAGLALTGDPVSLLVLHSPSTEQTCLHHGVGMSITEETYVNVFFDFKASRKRSLVTTDKMRQTVREEHQGVSMLKFYDSLKSDSIPCQRTRIKKDPDSERGRSRCRLGPQAGSPPVRCFQVHDTGELPTLFGPPAPRL